VLSHTFSSCHIWDFSASAKTSSGIHDLINDVSDLQNLIVGVSSVWCCHVMMDLLCMSESGKNQQKHYVGIKWIKGIYNGGVYNLLNYTHLIDVLNLLMLICVYVDWISGVSVCIWSCEEVLFWFYRSWNCRVVVLWKCDAMLGLSGMVGIQRAWMVYCMCFGYLWGLWCVNS
jgi:hypothetical protein